MFPFGQQSRSHMQVWFSFPLRGMVCVHFLGGLRAVQVDRLAYAAALLTVRRALTWRWVAVATHGCRRCYVSKKILRN